jgi:hypothetical protein
METTLPKFPRRVFTALELSKLYKVCKKTFMRWIKPFEAEIGERNGRYYTIAQVELIIERIGLPEGYED